jgi:hypothetical protein
MHYSSGQGSHPSEDPSAVHPAPLPGRAFPPENEVPSAVPISAVLGRTDDVAVALVGVLAYTTGLTFDLVVRLRTTPQGSSGHRVHEMLSGSWHDDDSDAEQQFLIGFQYVDGRTATNLPTRWLAGPADEDGKPDEAHPLLTTSSGSGGGRSYDQTYWLTPLPPPGPVLVVCTWPGFDIPESRTTLDGALIADAGSLAVTLWPWEPEDERQHQPREPYVPAGGWFADAVRRR